MLYQVLSCMHAYSLPIHCAETVRNFGAVNGQFTHPARVQVKQSEQIGYQSKGK